MVYLEPIKTNIITKKRTAYSQYASMQCLLFSFSFSFFFYIKIGIFTSGSQVCVDDLENSRPLSLDMNEYPGTEIIFAFHDIKLI
jgi:hypothetical protein